MGNDPDLRIRQLEAQLEGTQHTLAALQQDLESQVLARTRALEEERDRALGASRAKSSFLASMSHELRTPLNAIIGYSEMLAEDGDDPDVCEDLERIRSAGMHLLGLINDVLDLSKIEAGRVELLVEDVDVNSLVREVVDTVRPLVERNANAIETRFEGVPDRVPTDVTKLRQCLFNLLSNAAKFTERGTIRLEVQGDGGDLIFRVVDTGIGIAGESLERIFEPFRQAEAGTSKRYGGTGLGLALTHRLVELLGGTITVESTPGIGTRFEMHFPGLGTASAEGSPEISDVGEHPVLIIDDEVAAHELARRQVTRMGYSAMVASSGVDGLERAARRRPCLVLLDVLMPGMDGWAVLQRFKSDERLRDVPVVVCSFLEVGRLAVDLGADAFLHKPVARDQLAALLERYAPLPAPV